MRMCDGSGAGLLAVVVSGDPADRRTGGQADPASGRSYVLAGTGSCSLNLLDGEDGALLADRLSIWGLSDRSVPELI